MDLWVMYLEEPVFKAYVDKYCIKHQLEPKEAIRHALVKAYAQSLERKAYRESVETVHCGGC
jgi:hypothetical protein